MKRFLKLLLTLTVTFNVVNSPLLAEASSNEEEFTNYEFYQSTAFDLYEAEEGDLFIEYLSSDKKDYVSIEVLNYEELEQSKARLSYGNWSGGMPEGTWDLKIEKATAMTKASFYVTVQVVGDTSTIIDYRKHTIDAGLATVSNIAVNILNSTATSTSNPAKIRMSWTQRGSIIGIGLYDKNLQLGCEINYPSCEYRIFWDLV